MGNFITLQHGGEGDTTNARCVKEPTENIRLKI